MRLLLDSALFGEVEIRKSNVKEFKELNGNPMQEKMETSGHFGEHVYL